VEAAPSRGRGAVLSEQADAWARFSRRRSRACCNDHTGRQGRRRSDPAESVPGCGPPHLEPAEAEGGSLADVEDLGGAQERPEGSEVAFDGQGAEEAAEAHLGALPVAVALPVVPVEVRSQEADGAGVVQERAEAPVDLGAGDVEVRELEGPPQDVEQEVQLGLVRAPGARAAARSRLRRFGPGPAARRPAHPGPATTGRGRGVALGPG